MVNSASGVFTLFVVILVGPVYYASLNIYRNWKSIEAPSTPKPSTDDDERDIIDSKHYLFALVGFAIGIGNIWRFPFVIAQNGGAAAVIAYIICNVLVASPLFLYEMIVGQHTRLSTIRCYQMIRPRWHGLGIATSFLLFILLCYYGMVIAYTLPYIWGSLSTPLPWQETGAEEYWLSTVLGFPAQGEAVGGLGAVQGNLVASLFIFWLIVFMTVGFGKEVLAKITYVTVLLPCTLVVIMVVRTAFLDGAGDGIKFYIGRFDIEYLFNARTWAAACGQALFSMSPGLGTVITYSSYAKPKEDVYRACAIVAISNCAFSIVAAFATFSLVGHMAKEQGSTVEAVATRQGSGLAFITIAEAMQYFGSASNAMSVLFFSTLFLLGLDSAYAMEQTITSYAIDLWEERGWPKQARWKVSLGCCTFNALMGLVFTTQRGNSLLEVLDHFIGGTGLLFVVFMESLMLNWDFTYKRLEYALAKATYNNSTTPEGRRLTPSLVCKIDFYGTITVMPFVLGLYWAILDIRDGYGYHPAFIQGWGWSILVFIMLGSFSTIWKKDSTKLEPFFEENIKINDSERSEESNKLDASEPELQLTEVV
jgi:SNF family Na+-dependent transporter